jgi:hypothetical protein
VRARATELLFDLRVAHTIASSLITRPLQRRRDGLCITTPSHNQVRDGLETGPEFRG